MKFNKNNRKGFGLIELTLALAIAAIVGFIVIRGYSNAKQENDIYEVIKGVGTIQSAVEAIYGGRRNYNGISQEQLFSSLPKHMKEDFVGGGSGNHFIKLPGGVRSMVTPYSSTPENSNSQNDIAATNNWMLYLFFMSDAACRKIVSADFGRNVRYTIVNNDSMHEGKLSTADAIRLCTQEDGPNGNVLQLTMR